MNDNSDRDRSSSSDRRGRANKLLAEALDRSPGTRDSYVVEACGDDTALLSLIRELLAMAEDDDPLLDPDRLGAGPLWKELSDKLNEVRRKAVPSSSRSRSIVAASLSA